MRRVGRENLRSVETVSPSKRLKVLAVCAVEDCRLCRSLETILRPAEPVELAVEFFAGGGGDRSARLTGLLVTFQPSLVLLCQPAGKVEWAQEFFATLKKSRQELPVIVFLEAPDATYLNRLLHLGAVDFCVAPFRLEELLPRLLRWRNGMGQSDPLARQLESKLGLQQFLGESRAFVEAVQRIPQIARCDASVLITGETGTGKEMCARAIHHLGLRASGPFIPVNCGAIPAELVENELFGHDAGAFTGATSNVPGLIHDAEGGTLFLDEIDSLPLLMQVKFLRFLQDHEYRPLGGRTVCRGSVRIIAASNADLAATVRAGKFRADLFYRLNILSLKLPALRERRDDIPLLARYFLANYAKEFALPAKEFSPEALQKLLAYDWPGNIRELENLVERAIVYSGKSTISGEDINLPETVFPASEPSFKLLKAQAIAEFETAYVRRMLSLKDGNISEAARAAKKNRRAFWQLMRKHDIAGTSAGVRP